jgi:peptidoglycan/LPS O-acetylase OafA/YrhL
MTSRNQSLDVLRAIAVLLVIGFHFELLPVISKVGWCGVDLFFVLSGFLISGLLLDEYLKAGSIGLGRFWLRRGLKIWPSLYVYLLAMSPFLFFGVGWKELLATAFYYSNFITQQQIIFGHTWSLAIEEHFYILLPLLLIGLIRARKIHWVPWIAGFLVIVCLLLRTFGHWHVWVATPCRVDSLFAGVALAYWKRFNPSIFGAISQSRNLIVAGALFGLLALPDKKMMIFGFTGLEIAFGIILAWSVGRRTDSHIARGLAQIGIYSYSIYLWQQPFTAIHLILRGRIVSFLLAGLAVGLGVMMAKVIEVPMLDLRNRLIPKLAPALNRSARSGAF